MIAGRGPEMEKVGPSHMENRVIVQETTPFGKSIPHHKWEKWHCFKEG